MSDITKSAATLIAVLTLLGCTEAAKDPISVQGTKTTIELPASNLLSQASKDSIQRHAENMREFHEKVVFPNPITETTAPEKFAALRKSRAENFLSTTLYQQTRERYPVSVQRQHIAGVAVDIFTPLAGIDDGNKHRVLINLHGGGFALGAGTYSVLESMPIAAVGKIKVVSIDYRLLPEAYFPAGMDDIVAVYKALLEDYLPESIGFYGASAGGVLTALLIPRLQQEKLPIPGALTMINGAANCMMPWDQGDMVHLISAVEGIDYTAKDSVSWNYFKQIDMDSNDPLIYPGRYPEVIAAFPPTLLLDTSRGFTMSSTIHTHTQLIKQGVEADLHIWEGLDHYAIYNAELQETRDAYQIVARFFNKHLASKVDN